MAGVDFRVFDGFVSKKLFDAREFTMKKSDKSYWITLSYKEDSSDLQSVCL